MANKFANAQDLVALREIKEDVVVLKSGELRQILMVGGLNFSLKSESEQNIIMQSYQNFLNGLNFPLQIIIHSRKINIEKYLATLDGRRAEEASGLLQDQITEYQEFIRSFVQDNAIMSKTFLVVVSFAPLNIPSSSTMFDFLPFGNKKAGEAEARAKENEEANFKEAKIQLSQRVSQVVDGLSLIGLEVAILNQEQLIELFYNFYNPETVEKEKVAMPNV